MISKLWESHEATLRQLGGAIKAAFPDPRTQVTNELIEQVAAVLPDELQENLFGEVLGLVLWAQIPAVETAQIIGYYEVAATHTRPGTHRFTGRVPFVRVHLPDAEREDISTRIGIVYAGDHRLYTRKIFNEHYEDFLGWSVDRIELLTPARYLGARFAAVAIYMLYRGGKVAGFALEAGMATGEPMVVFCSKDGTPIVRRCGYSPTPFSDSGFFYDGAFAYDKLTGEPHLLAVDVLKTAGAGEKIVGVEAVFTRHDDIEPVFPSLLTAQAAMRVAAIAVARGSSDPMMQLLAPFGQKLDWAVAP